jgi:hypothetical protein
MDGISIKWIPHLQAASRVLASEYASALYVKYPPLIGSEENTHANLCSFLKFKLNQPAS